MHCPHIFSKQVGQIVEVQLGIHRRQLHGQKLQQMYMKGKRFSTHRAFQNGKRCGFMMIPGLCGLRIGIYTYLDLPLQRLHVVYDLIEHDSLAYHLKQATFFPISTLGTPSSET